MVTLIDYTALISAAAGIFAVIFTVIQLQHMEKHRNVDVSMKLFERAESERLLKAFKWVEEDFKFENLEVYRRQSGENSELRDYPYEVTAFFEETGFLVKKKFVDLDVIVDYLGPRIISDWQKLEPWVLELRKKKINQSFGIHFQGLYNDTVKYNEKTQRVTSVTP
ncbi:MAG: DUF4760 domain-containing protein [Nitrososphaeria archaeon]|jgi:hypothetical protein